LTLLDWLENYTIIHELLVVSLVLLPPLAVFWTLREGQLGRQDSDRAD
jgi:hypothetical protein